MPMSSSDFEERGPTADGDDYTENAVHDNGGAGGDDAAWLTVGGGGNGAKDFGSIDQTSGGAMHDAGYTAMTPLSGGSGSTQEFGHGAANDGAEDAFAFSDGEGTGSVMSAHDNSSSSPTLIVDQSARQAMEAKYTAEQGLNSGSGGAWGPAATASVTPSVPAFQTYPTRSVAETPVTQIVRFCARSLMLPEEEQRRYAQVLTTEHWLEQLESLRQLSDKDWSRIDIPERLKGRVRYLLQQFKKDVALLTFINSDAGARTLSLSISSTKKSTRKTVSTMVKDGGEAEAAPSVAVFVNTVLSHGGLHGEAGAVVHCLEDENWFTSVEELKKLSPAQWRALSIAPEAAKLLYKVLSNEESLRQTLETIKQNRGHAPPVLLTVESVLAEAAKRLQKSLPPSVVAKLREAKIVTCADLRQVSAAQWSSLGLPLQLRETAIQLLSQQNSPAGSRAATGDAAYGPRSLDINPNDPRVVRSLEEYGQKKVDIRSFLRNIGRQRGLNEEDTAKIAKVVIEENWVDSLDALRAAPQSFWEGIALPVGVVETIRRGLHDPELLQANLVFLADSGKNGPDVAMVNHAVNALAAEIPLERLDETLRSFVRLMETLLCSPFDAKKRSIRKSNANFARRAGRYPSALRLIKALGYEDAGDCWIVPLLYFNRVVAAHAALTQLALSTQEKLLKRARSNTTTAGLIQKMVKQIAPV